MDKPKYNYKHFGAQKWDNDRSKKIAIDAAVLGNELGSCEVTLLCLEKAQEDEC